MVFLNESVLVLEAEDIIERIDGTSVSEALIL